MLFRSKGEARRTTLYLNNEKIDDPDRRFEKADFGNDGLLLRAGKKKYCRIIIEN